MGGSGTGEGQGERQEERQEGGQEGGQEGRQEGGQEEKARFIFHCMMSLAFILYSMDSYDME